MKIKAIKTIIMIGLCISVVQCKSGAEVKSIKRIKVGKGPDAMFVTVNKKYLYVANVEDTYISIIDVASEKVIKKIKSTAYPWGFSRLGDSNIVAVSAYDKGIDLIDFDKHEIVRSKKVDFNVGGISSSSDGKFIYVIGTNTDKVYVIDVKSLTITKTFPTGKAPDGIGITFQDKYLYVTNTKDGSISIINVSTGATKVLKLGGKPELIHYNKDHSRLYISNFKLNKVYIFDAIKNTIIHEITGLQGAEEAVLSEDEAVLYVVNYKSRKIFSYDSQTFKKIPVAYITGKNPIGVVQIADKLYSTNFADNNVSVFEIRHEKIR